MSIPTEPIGSIPRPEVLLDGIKDFDEGRIDKEKLDVLYHDAVKDTIKRFEETGSPIITDGEQLKPSFATYPIQYLDNLSPDGVSIPFSDGHYRQLPTITSGPFKYSVFAADYLKEAKKLTKLPVKQAVIAASALSLLYPNSGIEAYPRDSFLDDLVDEAESDIRKCLQGGAHVVQMDFTEGRLALKFDPSGELLKQFVDINNRVLDRFYVDERKRIGVHTCPGGDIDSTHSADVDYAGLLPLLFQLNASKFYIQLASEKDRASVLQIISRFATLDQRVFIGVIDPINPRIETAEEVKERVLEAASIIDAERLGTTDDCGFSPFGDDTSTARDTAFAKIRARVEGTRLASHELGIS